MPRRRLPPPPKGDPNGTWLFDPIRRREVFVPFEDLHYMCKDIMHPSNAEMVEQDLGKMHFSKDPTYNMRRKPSA